MKKILISLAIIGVVAAIAVGATVAYFSDTETSTGNTISAGTIDISVDGKNPWSGSYTTAWTDFKPGVVQYIDFTVKNEGKNPVVLRKMLDDIVVNSDFMNEPKCSDLEGTWSGGACTGGSTIPTDFTGKIIYDMTITPVDALGNPGTPIIIIPEDWNIRLSDVNALWMQLGTLDPNESLIVKQSYRLDSSTDNKYQGDSLTFDINLYAEQVGGPGPGTKTGLIMENKDTTTWDVIIDGTWGILTWDTSGNYNFKGFGLNDSLVYQLKYWDGTPPENVIGGTGTPSGGKLTLTGTYAAFNTNVAAKYWLRPVPWSSSSDVNTLYEGNLVNQ